MIHKLTMGHFDVDALARRQLVVVRPLELDVVARLLEELGVASDGGRVVFGCYPLEFKDGYIECPWLMPWPVPQVQEFARRLCQETGCLMYDRTRREIVTPERLADW